jgi:hypothetical protein
VLTLTYGYEPWTTATHLEGPLAKRTVVRVEGPGHASEDATQTSVVDAILWVESGVPWLPTPKSLASNKSAAWIIDTHRGLSWRTQLAGAFDCVFLAQADAVDTVRATGVPAMWLPLAVPRQLCEPGPSLDEREYDVAFVGQAPPRSDRAKILDALRARFRVAPTGRYTPPDEMMDRYRRARVVINLPIGHDLNMRTFECAGARATLVTGPATNLDKVLPAGTYVEVDGVDPRKWTNAVEAALQDSTAQGRADHAFERVMESHTYDRRADAVLAALDRTPRREIPDISRARSLAAAWSRWGRVTALGELALPRADQMRAVATACAWSAAIRAKTLRRGLRERATRT